MTENGYGTGRRYAARDRKDKPYYYRPPHSPPREARGRDETEKKKKSAKSSVVISVSVVLIAALGIMLFAFFSSYFELENVSVSGNGAYTEAEIISSGGLKMGEKLYKIDSEGVRLGILEAYPDIASVSVKKHLPSEISIAVTFEVPKYFIKVTGEYFVLSENLKVLERCRDRDSAEEAGLVYVEMPDIKRCVTGEHLEFFKGDRAYIKNFLGELSASPFDSEVDRIYIKSKFDISIVRTGCYKVKLGDKNDGILKLKMADKVLEAGSYREMSGVVVDVSNVAESSVTVNKLLKIE